MNMINRYTSTCELAKLLEKVCWYMDARKTETADAILISLADEMATATASYIGELWKPINEGQINEERVLCQTGQDTGAGR